MMRQKRSGAKRAWSPFAPGLVALGIAASCASTTQGIGDGPEDSGTSSPCEDVTGGYVITYRCSGERLACTVEQQGCAAQLSCGGTGTPTLMEVTDNEVSFTLGEGTCTGTVSGNFIDGACGEGCVFQGLRTTPDPELPTPPPLACGFRVSDVIPSATEECDTCAETGQCCDLMAACTAPSACNGLLKCMRLKCGLTDLQQCAQEQCSLVGAAGGNALLQLVTCLSSNCPSCGLDVQTP